MKERVISASYTTRNTPHLLHPGRGKGGHGPRGRQQGLREVASPDIADSPVHRYRQQHPPKGRREVEGRLTKVVVVVGHRVKKWKGSI